MTHGFKIYGGNYLHFITNTIQLWIPVFSNDIYFKILSDSLCYCIEHKGLRIHAYVLMPNHCHLICSQIDGRLVDVIRDLKGFTSREIKHLLESEGRTIWLRAMTHKDTGETRVWQDTYHPEQIHSQEFCLQKFNYIHDNPVRAGFVDDPVKWKYSSAGFYYAEQTPIIPITPIDC